MLEHPYFSKHVTSLLYDASFYKEDRVDDQSIYAGLMSFSDSAFVNYDLEHMTEAYFDLWRRTKNNTSDALRHMIRIPRPESIVGDRGRPGNYYQGYFRYSMAFGPQCYIQDSDLPKEAFELIFSKIPGLRHMRMGDWRNLARADESLDSLRDRLFGNMLAPTVRGLEKAWDPPVPDFLFLLEMCCYRSRGDLQSISIGGHPY